MNSNTSHFPCFYDSKNQQLGPETNKYTCGRTESTLEFPRNGTPVESTNRLVVEESVDDHEPLYAHHHSSHAQSTPMDIPSFPRQSRGTPPFPLAIAERGFESNLRWRHSVRTAGIPLLGSIGQNRGNPDTRDKGNFPPKRSGNRRNETTSCSDRMTTTT